MTLDGYQEQRGIRELYYITHIENIPSILERGILSHTHIQRENIPYTAIYDEQIVSSRHNRIAPNGESLWNFANLYFKARNPMLYRLICELPLDALAVIGVRRDILDRDDIYITDGNAASANTTISPATASRYLIPQIMKEIAFEWWNEPGGSKRKIMAECLVPDMVPPEYIQTIYVANRETSYEVSSTVNRPKVEVVPEPHTFFQPSNKIELTSHLWVVEGDMFFSRFQTLTVSVNCVGIMGKGLASRAKYQFPDVYVRYQDACRKRVLRMGRPYLYKRESSLDYQLADDPNTMTHANGETWFLLFATKKHWRDNADIVEIEQGLKWLVENYHKEGIKSLAIPALGCGQGRLEWKDVGPLICKYLSALEIPVWVYLPAEKSIPDEYLSRDFLLSQVKSVV